MRDRDGTGNPKLILKVIKIGKLLASFENNGELNCFDKLMTDSRRYIHIYFKFKIKV